MAALEGNTAPALHAWNKILVQVALLNSTKEAHANGYFLPRGKLILEKTLLGK